MAKSVVNDVLDAMLNEIADNGDEYNICAGEPTTYAEATSTNNLAQTAMTTGDYTIADGDSSGRKLTMSQKSGISITADGNADHIAITDSAGSRLLYVTTLSNAQQVTSGNTADIGSWKIEVGDPA